MSITQHKGIRNIIFDLGGVILNINYYKTEKAFISLGIENFNELFNQFHADNFFKDFERGIVSPDQFVKKLQTYKQGLASEQIIAAWNAMLLDFPVGRIDFLLNLKKRYQTFLLSNTNAIHHDAFQKIELRLTGESNSLDNCFEKAYYSHEIGFRKPDKEIFEYVISQNGLVPEETLFIDDTLANVEAAHALKIKGLYLDHPSTIEELLHDY